MSDGRAEQLMRGWNWTRFLTAVLVIVILVIAIPYLLAPLYRAVNPVSTLMVWRWMTGAPVDRRWMPLERLGPALPRVVIVAEDGRFCSHHGVDFNELREVIQEADDLGEARGGSTISQQTAKNLFLWPGRSFLRKVLEFPLALWLDLVLGKRRLLEIYLNIVEWGPSGQFGAEAGARYAFGKAARELAPNEAGLLAAVLPNPHRRSARQPRPGVRRVAGIYQGRAAVAGPLDACLRQSP